MKSVYSPSIDPSIQPSVHSYAAVCIHHASESITWFRQSADVIGANLRNTVNLEKLSSMVTTDKKEYIHHTINLRNTSLPNKTINKTTNKNGLEAIKPSQRSKRSPTNYLYTKPSNQSTHPQSIRREQPYVYTMHQNTSHGFAKAQNVIGASLRNTVNPEKLLLMVTTYKNEYIHHNDTIHRRNTSLPYKTINKTTNKNGLGAIKPRKRPNRSPTNYLYTKPSTQSTHPQSIRRFSRPSTRVQPYVYIMHQNPSHGFTRVQNVIGTQPQKHRKSRKVINNGHDR